MSVSYYISSSFSAWDNLALDEWLLSKIGKDDIILYIYVNENAVIIGKNQNAWKECNISPMNDDGVQLARRISGGGAVYHDKGNLNFSFLSHKDIHDTKKQFEIILRALKNYEINAMFSGRNDIVLDGRKISGNAFCAKGDVRMHHGTLMINTDIEKLQKYLNVDPEKYKLKGLDSIRTRVCNICDKNKDFTVDLAKKAIIESLKQTYGEAKELVLDNFDGLIPILDKQQSWEWRFGESPSFDIEISKRFAWGAIELLILTESGIIKNVTVHTDAIRSNLDEILKSALINTHFQGKDMFCNLESLTDIFEVNDIIEYLKIYN